MPSTPTKMEMLVRQAIAREADVESLFDFQLDADLQEELELDDVAKVMVASYFEEHLQPPIPEIPVTDSNAWRTVRDVVNYMEARYRI